MAVYNNFYETIKEAQMRLRNTIVTYDGAPCIVMAITNHKKDGIFRIYLEPLRTQEELKKGKSPLWAVVNDHSPESPQLGAALDAWLDAHPSNVLRKQMNSPLFNKFRPFPLGMCNIGNGVYYTERQPLRPKTEQGLIQNMVTATPLTLGIQGIGFTKRVSGGPVDIYSPAFRACIMGTHPSAQECLAALQSGEYDNEALAFHREFAFALGPVGLAFLAYKSDIVGVLPKGDFSILRLDPKFAHVKEVVEGLSLFSKLI